MPPMTERQKRDKRDAQIESLGSLSANAQGRFRHAWELFIHGDEEKRIQAEAIATKLLRKPQLGDLHKAGCHLIRACGIKDFL